MSDEHNDDLDVQPEVEADPADEYAQYFETPETETQFDAQAEETARSEETAPVTSDDQPDAEPSAETPDAPETVAPEEPSSPSGVPDGRVEINGRLYDAQQVADYLAWVEQVQSDPRRWEAIQQVAQGQQPVIQDDFEDEDPKYRQLRQEVETIKAREAERERQEIAWALQDATDTFKQEHSHLDDAGMQKVIATTGRLRLIEAMRQADPGMPRNELVRAAFENAYRIEYWGHQTSNAQAEVVADLAKRRRAARSSGTSVSAPRIDPVPTTDAEIRAAMIRDIREAQGQGG